MHGCLAKGENWNGAPVCGSCSAVEVLALEAMSRDLDIAGLIGQILVAAINKDMIRKILR
jgi:hypothetical protein